MVSTAVTEPQLVEIESSTPGGGFRINDDGSFRVTVPEDSISIVYFYGLCGNPATWCYDRRYNSECYGPQMDSFDIGCCRTCVTEEKNFIIIPLPGTYWFTVDDVDPTDNTSMTEFKLPSAVEVQHLPFSDGMMRLMLNCCD